MLSIGALCRRRGFNSILEVYQGETMADVFISYSAQDQEIARFIERHLVAEGLTVFLATVSLKAGDHWPTEIMRNLRGSTQVILLASRAACQSPFVQQELGGALYAGKRIVPLVWDMPPSDLPGWAAQYQAIDLRGSLPDVVAAKVEGMARNMRADKDNRNLGLIVVGIVLGLIFSNKPKPGGSDQTSGTRI
jgi:hypothetical protein